MDIKSQLREIKISLINNDKISLVPNLKKIRKAKNVLLHTKYWKFLKNNKENFIITGSAALYAFGLIDRIPNDIDLILLNSEFNKPGKKYIHGYPDDNNFNLCYLYKGVAYDYFNYIGQNYIEYNGFKFQSPIEILSLKYDMLTSSYRSKDASDLNISLFRICKIIKKAA